MDSNVLESIKTPKQKLYEKHILDSEGRLKLYSPTVQAIVFKILEANGLETAVKAYDKEQEKKNKKATE